MKIGIIDANCDEQNTKELLENAKVPYTFTEKEGSYVEINTMDDLLRLGMALKQDLIVEYGGMHADYQDMSYWYIRIYNDYVE